MNTVEKEIADLHDFFRKYFSGEVSKESLTRFTGVIDDNFTLIPPSGALINRDEIVEIISKSHNSGILNMWTELVAIKEMDEDFISAIYYEYQEKGDKLTKRISTVIFRKDESAINGLIWVHVHETFIQN